MKNKSISHSYKKLLHKAASQLNSGCKIPINVEGACDSLNIKLTRVALNEKKVEYIKTTKGIEIRLPAQTPINTNQTNQFERYLVAHEIGHFLLDQKFGSTPSNEEYWDHEHLCDYFARNFLIPTKSINKIFNNKLNSKQLYGFLAYLMIKYNVTWITAAYRITDLSNKYIFINFKEFFEVDKGKGYRINFSTLEKSQYVNTKIKLKSNLYEFLDKTITIRKKLYYFCDTPKIRETIILKSLPGILSHNPKSFSMLRSSNNIRLIIETNPKKLSE